MKTFGLGTSAIALSIPVAVPLVGEATTLLGFIAASVVLAVTLTIRFGLWVVR